MRRHSEGPLGAVTLGGQDADNCRNHIARFLDHHTIADPEILARDLLLIVKRGPAHGAAGDKDRLKLRDGCQDTAAPDLHGDVEKACLGLLRLVLVGDRPAGGLAGGTEAGVLRDQVGFNDGTVRLKGKSPTDLPEFSDCSHDLPGIACRPMSGIRGKSPPLQQAEELLHALRQGVTGGGLECSETVEDS